MEEHEVVEEVQEEFEVRHHDLMELFETLSFTEKIRRMSHGLKQPKDTGEYKWAKLQVQRLSAPLAAVVVPVVAVSLLVVFAAMAPETHRTVTVTVVEPEEMPELEDIEEIKEEPPEPPEPMDIDFTPDVTVVTDTPAPPAPPTDFSPQPAEFDAVAMVKSPVIMKGIYGSRTPGMRGSAMARYGAPSGVEGAVMRALRWLKKEQNSDGSWNKCKPAMTALALLAYLAHGETPSSLEFGPTVEKAIRWLVDNQTANGSFKGRDGHDYTHPIATYALCEAYALTKVPMLKEAAEKAIYRVIKGQNPSGGFNYNLNPTTRDDTSYMGWCAQSLKAAKMAGLEPAGLDACMKKSILGFQKNSHASGGFGYTGPGRAHGLTGVGVLCMQLLGAANKAETKLGLSAMADATFNWEPKGKMNKNYYWYYITQAKFHDGGETWKSWNNIFAPTLVKNQTIIKNGIEGPKGKMVDIGWWDMPKELSGHTDGPVMNTALATLQLEVYYRYLPTFMTPKATEDDGIDAIDEDAGLDEDIDIEISI